MSEERALTIIEGQRDPELVLEAASRAAKALQRVVESKPKKVMIGGKQHLMFEDWQTLGQFYGCTVRTGEAKYVEIDGVPGAYATAEVIDFHSGIAVGGAGAYCMSNEENWAGKPWFQLASMAQTRAGAKALRNRLAWVAVLAGYEPTPAEEMTGNEQPAQKPEHFCETHQVAFRRFEKDGRVWYSHKDGDSWCNEAKAREVQPRPAAPTPAPTNGKPAPPAPAPKATPPQQPPQSGDDSLERDVLRVDLEAAAQQLGVPLERIREAFVSDHGVSYDEASPVLLRQALTALQERLTARAAAKGATR